MIERWRNRSASKRRNRQRKRDRRAAARHEALLERAMGVDRNAVILRGREGAFDMLLDDIAKAMALATDSAAVNGR